MSSAPLSWSFDADYLQACNCDYGCPCEFSAPPTPGFCEGTGTWRIKTGRCGDVPLDGLCLGFAAHWPKAIHLGGGTVTVFVDERANEEQRRALENIALGKLGGLPFEILATTFSAVQETRFIPFEFLLAGRNSAPGSVTASRSISNRSKIRLAESRSLCASNTPQGLFLKAQRWFRCVIYGSQPARLTSGTLTKQGL